MKAMRIDFKDLFIGTDMRSPNGALEACEICLNDPQRTSELFELIAHGTQKHKMCAADALEQISGRNPELLQVFQNEIFEIAKTIQQKEVRWHMAQIAPRLNFDESRARQWIEILKTYLNDKSRIVVTFAMNAIWEISKSYSIDGAQELIENIAKNGPPSVKARARILLGRLTNYKK